MEWDMVNSRGWRTGIVSVKKEAKKMEETTPLQEEILAFEEMKADLLKHHYGKFVVFKGKELVGAFDTFDNAAREAIQRFGNGPYLIRQVGGPTGMPLPASVAYRPVYAAR